MFSFRYTSSVCKHKNKHIVVQDVPKFKLQTLVHIFAEYWWILHILYIIR